MINVDTYMGFGDDLLKFGKNGDPINYYASNQLLYVQSNFIRLIKFLYVQLKFMRPNKFYSSSKK